MTTTHTQNMRSTSSQDSREHGIATLTGPTDADVDAKGGYFVMIDSEQSAGHYPTLQEARDEGQKMCNAEPLPCTFSIQDEDGNEIEPITRSDGKGLAEQVADFNALYRRG